MLTIFKTTAIAGALVLSAGAALAEYPENRSRSLSAIPLAAALT